LHSSTALQMACETVFPHCKTAFFRTNFMYSPLSVTQGVHRQVGGRYHKLDPHMKLPYHSHFQTTSKIHTQLK
jgi:hypothetical protein